MRHMTTANFFSEEGGNQWAESLQSNIFKKCGKKKTL